MLVCSLSVLLPLSHSAPFASSLSVHPTCCSHAAQFFVGYDDILNGTVVTYRGTMSSSLMNWIDDLKAEQVRGRDSGLPMWSCL